MPKEIVLSKDAPVPVASYSQAVRSGNLLFLSGQIGIDPATQQMVSGGIRAETTQVIKNLGAVLAAASASYADLVQVTVYLCDMNDFTEFDAAYAQGIGSHPPARATVGVVALPRGARVEVHGIAMVPTAGIRTTRSGESEEP